MTYRHAGVVRRGSAVVVAAGSLVVLAATWGMLGVAPPSALGAGFTDVTTSSGVANIVVQHYQFELPIQLWLNGLNLSDIDGDGDLDLLIGSHGTQMAGSAGNNDGLGHFAFVPPQLEAGKNRYQQTQVPYPGGEIRTVFDFNEDGKLDMLADYADDTGAAYLNQSTALPANWSFKTFTPGFPVFNRGMIMADLNRDGIVDHVEGCKEGKTNHQTFLFLGQGNAKWATTPALTLDTLYEAQPIAVDLNGDGFLDLVISQRGYNPAKRMILINDGQMHFTDVTASSGFDPTAAYTISGVGDVNQDGAIDLICTDGIYLNDGQGHFTNPGLSPFPSNCNCVVVDIDNDGIPDVYFNGKSYVLRGLGGGTFSYINSAWGLPTNPSYPAYESACFGDIDGDGMMDLLMGGPPPTGQERGVSVFRNNLPKQGYLNVQLVGAKGNQAATGAKIRLYQAGGLNNPAKLLAYEQVAVWGRQTFNSYYAKTHTERHFGLGPRTSVDVSVEFYPSGKKVTRTAVPANNTVIIDESGIQPPPVPPPPKPNPPPTPPPSPSGKFTIVTPASGMTMIQSSFAATDWISGLHLVDLDGDNKLDLYVSIHGAGTPVAALNNGKGVFTKAAGSNYPQTEIHMPYDIDENGKVDLSMTYNDGGGRWWTNQSTVGNLAFTATAVTRDTNTARQNVMIDINKDGKVDWLRGTSPGIVMDYGDGHGNFTAGSKTINTGAPDPEDTSIFPIDLDNSGNISLIVQWGAYTFVNGKSRIYRNDGTMNFTDVTTAAGLVEDLAVKGVGDYNQDGYTDLLVLENSRSTWSIYLNDGAGHFTKKANALSGLTGTAPYAQWGMAAYTDFDNDGIGDILVNFKNRLVMLRGTGSGNFTYMNATWGIVDQAKCTVDDGLCFGDIDGDGMLDVIGYNGNIDVNPTHFDVYHNDLTKKNWINVRPVGLPGNKGAAGAKIRVYVPGGPLLWYEQVALIGKQSAMNYYSFVQTERHFGLGVRTKVDVTVEFYPSGKKVTQKGVNINSTIVVPETP